MSVEEQITKKAREIQTDGYPMSIGEVISLYKEQDIDIHPEFQRIFRWSDDQKSRLIESILLGIPIPPIFVSQREDGIWDVIDGVQRLSTIFEFIGEYRDHDGHTLPPSTLKGTEYLPDLEGYTWDGPGEKQFTKAMQRDVKRSKLEFRIIRKESDKDAKYDLFQRLNSGSELSPQEARNCLLVMLNMALFEEITRLSQTSDFLACVPLSDAQEDRAYRQELVLRFFVQKDYDGVGSELRQEHGEYITSWMRKAAPKFATSESPFDSDLFANTFSLLKTTLGEDSFRRWDGSRHLGPFSIACFEFVTTGVAANLEKWSKAPDKLIDKVRSVWIARSEFRNNSGTGVSPRRRVPKLVTSSRSFFAAD